MFKEDRISELLRELVKIVGVANVMTDEAELTAYSYDAGQSMAQPEAVIIFNNVNEIAPVVKILSKAKIPFIPRMAGTNLTGGVIPLKGGVILNMSRLNKIIYIDTKERVALVEAGVINGDLQRALKPLGYFYAPDPASADFSTIGGNIAENAGGPCHLQYGSAADNTVKLEVITPNGEINIWAYNDNGPDLTGLISQSEGTLGIITKAWVKITPFPKYVCTVSAAFATIENAINASDQILNTGIKIRALEAMDKIALEVSLKKSFFLFPHTMKAMLLIELDGNNKEVLDKDLESIRNICSINSCLVCETAETEEERLRLWSIRNGILPALSQMAPNIVIEEGYVPRTVLPIAVKSIREILKKYRLTAGLLIHAGTGAIHPHIVFDKRNSQDVRRVKIARNEITKVYLSMNGSSTGTYGIGVDKRVSLNWMYSTDEINFLYKIKGAFDHFNLANPDKILPVNDDTKLFEEVNRKHERSVLQPQAHTLIAEMRYRYEHKIKSIIVCSGTYLQAPQETMEMKYLNTSILNTPPVLNKKNLTVKVSAGTNTEELRQALNKEGMDLAIPKMDGTVGGVIAAKYSPEIMRILLGIEIVTPSGEYLNFSVPTLKSATGFNICNLYCGSYGAYGVILSTILQVCNSNGNNDLHINQKTKLDDFVPNKYHILLKQAIDPNNLLNPWIYDSYLKTK